MTWLWIAIALVAGYLSGFYRGRRFERMRIARALAANPVAGMATILRAGSILRPGPTDEPPDRKPWRAPGSGTRH